MAFTYTEPDWEAVAAVLAQLSPRPSAETLQGVRSDLERVASDFLEGVKRPKADTKGTLETLTRMQSALSELNNLRGLAGVKTEAAALSAHLDDVTDELRDYRARRSGRSNPQRQMLYDAVLSIWSETLGRPLKTSRETGATTRPSGPLIRYLTTVLKPVLGEGAPKAETMRDIVGRYESACASNTKTMIRLAARQRSSDPD